MRVDLYTKGVLTIIAGALLYLCVVVAPIGTPVHAQLAPTQVVIAGWYDASSRTIRDLTPSSGLPMTAGANATANPGGALAQPLLADPSSNAPATATPRSAPLSQMRCQATTQKGAQCLRNAKSGSKYCYQHGAE